MKKLLAVTFTVIVLLATVILSGCGGDKVTLKAVIPDYEGKYFSAMEDITVDMKDYLSFGEGVTFEASSTDDFLSVAVDGDKITVDPVGFGCGDVTIVAKNKNKDLYRLTFTVDLKECSVITCAGDSLTYGSGTPEIAYTVFLQQYLGNSVTVVNCGLNGANITGYGGHGTNFKYSKLTSGVNNQYTRGVNANPDVILIMLGTNDATGWQNAKHTFETEYQVLLSKYMQDCPDAEIILLISPPTFESNSFNIPNKVIKESVNPIQRALAEKFGFATVDMRNAFEQHPGGYDSFFVSDGVHFSETGAKFVARKVADALMGKVA